MFNPYYESVNILMKEEYENKKEEYADRENISMILEDVNSPATQKFQEKLYTAVLNKAHIDFGDIPKSEGNIRNYSGYSTMCETLDIIEKLAVEHKAINVVEYVNIVKSTIKHLELLSSTFQRGFATKTTYVAMEYDTYVYFCVEATTALIYSFVDVIKSPDKQLMDITIRNTKMRADDFYFEQLKKFNNVQDNMGIDYRKMLENMCDKGKNNLTGTALLGIGTVLAVSIAIIPVTREIIYQIYNFRGKLSEALDIQSKFLELNRACVENNEAFDAAKKQKILKKQENLSKTLKKLSDAIRVKSAKSILDSKRELKNDNKMLSIDNIKDEVSNSPFELL